MTRFGAAVPGVSLIMKVSRVLLVLPPIVETKALTPLLSAASNTAAINDIAFMVIFHNLSVAVMLLLPMEAGNLSCSQQDVMYLFD